MGYRRTRYSGYSVGWGEIIMVYLVLMFLSSMCSSNSATASSSTSSNTQFQNANLSSPQNISYNSKDPAKYSSQDNDSNSGSCDPSYPNDCLRDGIGDYDCAGGSGNGPNYVRGPVRVVGSDPFGLDRDGDGWGCE
jgi:hypothetical protein